MSQNQQNIYPIQILNDIHNYFPDILYNPGRFRNVQDLLGYIISVANMSPYNRGLNLYNRNNLQRNINLRSNIGQFSTPINVSTGSFGIPTTTQFNNMNNDNTILGTYFTSLLSELLPYTNNSLNQSFLDQRVLITPTNEQINNATSIYTAANSEIEVCAICQDNIEQSQEVRRINHCNHNFHKDCIDVWFRSNVRCPICRFDIRELENRSQNNSSTTPNN
jgi:hypothetical protein